MSGNKLRNNCLYIVKVITKRVKRLLKPVLKRVPSFVKTDWFALTAVLIMAGTLIVFNLVNVQKNKYLVRPADRSIIGKSSVDTNLIKESAKGYTYQRSAQQKPNIPPQVKVSDQENSTGSTLYTSKLPKNPKDGITFADEKQERNVNIKSLSDLSTGKLQDGRIVYPVSATEKHIYSLKLNGLKEDILLTKPTQKVLTFSWQLSMGKELEARLSPDGSVGIYSVSSDYFGDISIGDDKSQKLVDNARINGKKTNMVYIIPKPYIVDSRGTKIFEDVSYKLDGNTLTLTALNMIQKNYPITIDPSIAVTSTAEFKLNVGEDSSIDYATTTGQIATSAIDTGATGASTSLTTTGVSGTRSHNAAVVYNGYLYAIGGFNTTGSVYLTTIDYALLASDGTVTSWSAGTSLMIGVANMSAVAYNGYLYVLGGWNGTTYYNRVAYAAIASNGTLGSWNYTSSSNNDGTSFVGGFTTARYGHGSFAYNGYIYVVGGTTSGGNTTDVQYAPINPNGTIGTWTATNVFTTARANFATTFYNGFVYISGGGIDDIQYASVNTNGTLNAWVTNATGLRNGAISGHTMVAYRGFMYLTAGGVSEASYAKINLNGSVSLFTITDTVITRYAFASVAYNGHLYHMGGRTSNVGANLTSNYYQRMPIGVGRAGIDLSTGNTSFTTSRRYHTTAVYNGFMYIIGGFTTSNVATVQFSALGAEGTNGTWTATTAFTTGRHSHTSVVHNGYLYVIGGCSTGTPPACTAYLSDVQYALIAADGTVGTWTATTSFTTARKGHTSVVFNNYVYVIGGTTGTPQSDVQYAYICDGTTAGGCTAGSGNVGKVSAWASTTAFTSARYWHTSVAYNGFLYVIGGWNDTTYFNTVQYAQFASNGTVGTWTATTAFTAGRYSHTSVVYNGYLYIDHGLHDSIDSTCLNTTSVTCQDVQYAPIASNGSVGTWTANQFLVTSRSAHTAVVHNGILLLFGGANSVGTNVASGVHLSIGAVNALGTWTTMNSFTTARSGHTSVTYNGYYYVIGGNTGSATNGVQYGALTNAGVNGTTSATSALTTARYNHSTVVYKGFMYAIGGWNGTTYYNDVEYSAVASAGTLGTWASATSSNFTTARYGHTSVVYNNYLFVIGGKSSGGALSDIQFAYICDGTAAGGCTAGSANIGKLGTWVTTTSFTTARYQHTSMVYNGYLYVIGGWDGTNYYASTQFAAIASDGTIGTWAYTNSFMAGRYGHTSVVNNSILYVVSGYHSASDTLCSTVASNYCTNIQFAQLYPDGTIGSWNTNTAASLSTGLREHTSFMYNGYMFIVGGTTGSLTAFVQSLPIFSPPQKARYERIFDTGSGNTPATLTINGSSTCGYDLEYKTGNTSYGSITKVPKSAPGTAITISAPGDRYMFLAITLDDTECSGVTTVTDITLVYKGPPDAPILFQPAAAETNTDLNPEFRFGSTETFTDYLMYKIELCSNSNCSSIIRTMNQVSSQVGWQAQSQQGGTAYSGGPVLLQNAVHVYQPTILSGSTQYWWRAYAIAPGGTNGFSAASAISTFTTRPTPPIDVNIRGGTNLKGGTNLR